MEWNFTSDKYEFETVHYTEITGRKMPWQEKLTMKDDYAYIKTVCRIDKETQEQDYLVTTKFYGSSGVEITNTVITTKDEEEARLKHLDTADDYYKKGMHFWAASYSGSLAK